MILHMHGTTSAHLGLFHVNVDLVTQVGGRQARCCSLVAVKDHPQAVSKHMQPVIAVARARPAQVGMQTVLNSLSSHSTWAHFTLTC